MRLLSFKCVVVFLLFGQAQCMFRKRALPNEGDEVPDSRRFRNNIGDMFLSNDISGQRLQSVAANSMRADPHAV